ncbi:TPR repeat-containing protein DDB_G0287407-like, partial [Amphiura filiformis]|uniref:TPR repeat-containing protein DDB_G0287407-like n=1 Tax=Amphiura filiformis TaxID=82378 RepID=UPI003B21DDE7
MELAILYLGHGGNGDDHGSGGATRLCAMMIYDPAKYKEPKPTRDEVHTEMIEKQKISDNLVPLDRAFSLKEMKLAGWSYNLLQNASAELGDLSHWDVDGDWTTLDGGDQTERKFVSSYETCTKYQEVDLTQHFDEKYLDSCPDIQASESFHEGSDGGGYYALTVTLMTSDGKVIAQKTTGTKGKIETPEWIRETLTFKGYRKGVRRVGFQTKAKDSLYWAGYFGAHASAAVLRVRSEAKPDDTDQDGDVVEAKLSTDKVKELDKMVAHLYDKYKDGLHHLEELQEAIGSDVLPPPAVATSKTNSASVKTRSKNRQVRVFVSSTFVDFHEEREILIKKAFREVNHLCRDRGVFFTYIDLRWGITTEQSQNGKTIDICLSEIERCKYFICLLGDRFGWNQRKDKIDKLLDFTYDIAMGKYKWLENHRFDTSVTKLEVLHAALENKKVAKDRTFFYLRESLPPDDPTPREQKKKSETPWHYDRQQELRNAVKTSGLSAKEYKEAEKGCDLIKEDLLRCINEDYPPGSQLTPLQREREAHEAFAVVRQKVYIGGEEYFKAIDDHFEKAAKGDNQPLLIAGASGLGKSALIANWCKRFEEKHPKDFLFMHFIGSSSESTSHLNLLRRLYEELRLYLQEDLVVPSSDRNLVIELPSWLKRASNKGRKVMLVLDALNQLDSGGSSSGEEQDLKWLPKQLPQNVHLLMSALPGRALSAVKKAGWSIKVVHPLNRSEMMKVMDKYMEFYAKTLTVAQKEKITNAKQSSNPLYLKALLEEIRMFGRFEKLDEEITKYLESKNPGELFEKILERLENDFDKGAVSRPGLVCSTTVAIWCSRRGMSEEEMLSMLKVETSIWSPFYLSLDENLVNRNGIVNFFHDYLRQAVESKYLRSPEDKHKGYLMLVDFFDRQQISDRYVDEVPYLLAEAGELERLKATILNIDVFQRLMKTEDGKFQLMKSWQLLGGYEQVENAYRALKGTSQFDKAVDKVGLIRSLAEFFMQLGLLNGARLEFEHLLKELESKYCRTNSILIFMGNNSHKMQCNHPDVIDVLINLGTVCQKLHLLDDAYNYFHEALSRQQKPKMPAQKLCLVKALVGMGTVMRLQGNVEMAKRFLMRAQEVAVDVLGSSHHYVAAIIGQISELSYSQGMLEEATLLYLLDLE